MVIPQQRRPEYPEHDELREEATRRAARFTDPARLSYLAGLANRPDWASRVLGFYCHGLRHISVTDAELLAVADERGITPAEPSWMVEDRQRDEQRRNQLDEHRRQVAARDAAAWRNALDEAAATVEAVLQVFANPTARPRYGMRHNLGHAVPNIDVYSGVRSVRTHPAGRALCESPTRARPLLLESMPSAGPATCDRCLIWTVKVRTSR